MTIEAADRHEAESTATDMEMLIESINPAPPPSVLSYHNPAERKLPQYAGLVLGQIAFRVIGALWIGAGVIAFFAIAGAGRSESTATALAAFGLAALYGIGCVMVGCIFLAASSACEAMRDMALRRKD